MDSQKNNNPKNENKKEQNMFNKPLSIEYIRKLKKPQSVPTALDLNNGLQSFQGSLLEEWLLQTLDEHIQTSIDQYQVFPAAIWEWLRVRIFCICRIQSH